MATPRLPTEERRAEIADAALRLISTRGIAALTTSTLAAEVGVTTGALFRHFASREQILEEVVARVEGLLMQPALALVGLPPAERLEAFLTERIRSAGGRPGVLALLMSHQFSLALPPAAAQRLANLVDLSRGFLVATLQEGATLGQFRTDIPPAELAVIVMGTVQMLALHTAGGPAGRAVKSPDAVRKALRALLEPPHRHSRS